MNFLQCVTSYRKRAWCLSPTLKVNAVAIQINRSLIFAPVFDKRLTFLRHSYLTTRDQWELNAVECISKINRTANIEVFQRLYTAPMVSKIDTGNGYAAYHMAVSYTHLDVYKRQQYLVMASLATIFDYL